MNLAPQDFANKSLFLNDFLIVKPAFSRGQDELIDWMSECHLFAEKNKESHINSNGDENQEKLKKALHHYAVKSSQIEQRYFECPDALTKDFSNSRIYRVNEQNQAGVDIKERTLFYSAQAQKVFEKIYETEEKPQHIVHVTCTGYISPSAPQRLVAKPEWGNITGITHAYHMGCYAAIPAVLLTQGIVGMQSLSEPSFKADIVHTEMCSLHMNPAVQTPEQIVVQSLFADGHIKYSVTSVPKSHQKNLRIIAIAEKLVPHSENDMSWIPSSWGMEMTLSRHVPAKIKTHLKQFVAELFKKAHIEPSRLASYQFAVHPGGPKIIESVEEVLELSDKQTKQSRNVLKHRGNMSSATLPHIWNEILEDPSIESGKIIVSLAFGPGLTLFGSVFEVVE